MSTQSTRFSRLAATTEFNIFQIYEKIWVLPSLEITVKQCRDLDIQFQSVNYALVDKICENFEENKL